MSYETIGDWISSAKYQSLTPPTTPNLKIGREVVKTDGNAITEMAERFLPWLMKMAHGVRDKDGSPVQPAHVRSVALNLAQRIIKEQDTESHA